MVMHLYADGSGFSGACAIYVKIVGGNLTNGKRYYFQVFNEDIPSEELEYKALIKALSLAKPGSKIFSDNMGVVDEVILLKKPRDKNKHLFNQAREIIKNKPNLIIQWIPRHKNLAGIYLEKRLKKLHSSYTNPLKLINRRKEWKNKIYGKKRRCI